MSMMTIQTAHAAQTTSTHPATHASNASMETQILHYINQYRIKHGLSTLTLHPAISKEATQHSAEMARHQIPFGHHRFSERVKRLSKAIPQANGCAENVAYRYKDAADVVKNWLRSPGHLRNIRGHYQLTGIGTARDEHGHIYYTQLFVRTTSLVNDRKFRIIHRF